MDKPKWTDVAIVILTAGIVFLAYMQWKEMNDSGKQTDKIITADERLAAAMETSNRNSERALKASLDANAQSTAESDKALNASVAAARNDQRAWFGVKEITLASPIAKGKPVQISIVGLNTGKTPALDVSLGEVRVGPSETDRSRDFVYSVPDREVVAPNHTDVFYPTLTYSDDSIKALLAGTIKIYVAGKVDYRDVFGTTHTTTFCAYYPTDGPTSTANHFFNCKNGNSMN
jgi:hypothetical protein